MFNDEELFKNLRETWVKEAEEVHGIENAEQYVEDMKQIMKDALEDSKE